MGLTENIQDINKRITLLEKKQEEAKKALAVEEHKLKEIQVQLKEEGYDVSKMKDADIDKLLDKLSEAITAEMGRLQEVLDEAEEQYKQFQELK